MNPHPLTSTRLLLRRDRTWPMPQMPHRGRTAAALLALLLGATNLGRGETVIIPAVADTFMNSGLAANNAGGHGWFDVGQDGVGGVRRGLIRFDLGEIPAGSTVTSVTLRLTVSKVPMTGGVDSTMDLRRLEAGWGEGNKVGNNGLAAADGEANWTARLLGTAVWTSAGALDDAATASSASAEVGGAVGQAVVWSGAGLVDDVQLWLDSPDENFGWLLTSQAEGVSRSVRAFASREAASGVPELDVGYSPAAPSIIDNPIAERVPKGDLTIELSTVVEGLTSPLGLAAPDDDSSRMFIYDQDGRVWVLNDTELLPTPLLDIRDRLVVLGNYDERGLLGFAVHPGFGENPLVYTYSSEPWQEGADFTNDLGSANNHQSVIAEWRMDDAEPDQVDPTSRREILRIDQPQSNHNGGPMHFGPDGHLYVVLGDGGQANDVAPGHPPEGNGQNLDGLWGALIRLDVSGRNSANGQYGIPTDNPFVDTDGLDEIYAYGFRNPFAFSFDRMTGDLYLGDVGQGKIEEINTVIAGGNYGWNVKEGSFWFDGQGNIVTAPVRPAPPGLIDPIAEYDHDDGAAIIGGYVYRGSAVPALTGRYVFGDWGSFGAPSGRLYYLDETNAVREFQLGEEDRSLGLWIKGFGQDLNGELYVFGSTALGPDGTTGKMLKFTSLSTPIEIATSAGGLGSPTQFSWSGGSGPFVLQRKNAVNDRLWMDAAILVDQSVTVDAGSGNGFLRVLDTVNQPSVPLSAALGGAAERPDPVTTDATGLGLFNLEGSTLTFSVSYTGLSGAATAAHIHGPAGTGFPGPVLIDLSPYNGAGFGTNGTLSGSLVLTEEQKALVMSGQTYVNVHTPDQPAGEIRGQIAPVLMQVELSGMNQRAAPVHTAGTGLGTLTLVGDQLSMNVTYGGLSGVATAAHFHGPADASTNASVLIDLSPSHDGEFGEAGSFSGSITLSATELSHLLSGLTYINIHTPNHPGGEVRGQVVPKPTAVPLTTVLSGLAVVPEPLTNSGTGSGTLMLEGSQLTFNFRYEGLSGPATAAHFHGPAPASDNAGVLIDLAPFHGGAFGIQGSFSGTVTITESQRTQLLGGQTYVNIHTPNHTGGEIRGQVVPVLMTSVLSGANERPTPNDSSGTGLAVAALIGKTLNLVVAYDGLTGPAIGAHIHGPADVSGSAGVLVDLAPFNGGAFDIAGALSGAVELTPSQLGALVDERTYLNLHTEAHEGGEIRGQILRR